MPAPSSNTHLDNSRLKGKAVLPWQSCGLQNSLQWAGMRNVQEKPEICQDLDFNTKQKKEKESWEAEKPLLFLMPSPGFAHTFPVMGKCTMLVV